MDENSKEQPEAEHRPVSTRFNRDQLRLLFRRQKRMLPAFAIQFLYLPFFGLLGTPFIKYQLMMAAFGIVVLVAIMFCIVTVFRLTQPLAGTLGASLLAMFMLVPYLGLIGLVIANQSAKSELNRHGVEVGLFGTEEDSI